MGTASTMALHGPFESPVVAPVTALVRLLDELREVVERIPDGVFTRVPAGRPSGSPGAHVRHCLDHVAAFLDGASAGRVSYDHRRRGTAVETSRAAALAHIATMTTEVLDLDPRLLARPVFLEVRLDARGTTTVVQSTVARELVFVINHTIHHNATMGLLLCEIGANLPYRFGVAPSTPTAGAESAAGRATGTSKPLGAETCDHRSGLSGPAATPSPARAPCAR
jgi:DinB superfamily